MKFQKHGMLTGILTLLSVCANAQPTIQIPLGTPALADGINDPGEWDDAESVEITVSASKKVQVRYKHDGSNLYVAYWGSLESANIRFPELLLDPQNDKSPAWQPDDWWFHVSATDCESQGQHSNYSNCNLAQPDWTGAPNMTQGAPYTDSIEVMIPFSKVGIQNGDTLGLAFEVTNTANVWNYWPPTAKIGQPDTWATAVISQGPVNATNHPNNPSPLRLFPNPASGAFTVEWDDMSDTPDVLVLLDARGRVVLRQTNLASGSSRVEVSALPPGVYCAVITGAKESHSCSVVIY